MQAENIIPPINAERLQEIVDLANSVPEIYRQKCFEILLSHELDRGNSPLTLRLDEKQPQPQTEAKPSSNLLPIDIKAYFNQYHLDLAIINILFHIEGTEIRPIYSLQDTTKVKSQMNLALLLALETAIHTGQFELEVEYLRKRCQDLKCYDMANFMRHLRNHARYFKTIDNTNLPLVLSIEGKSQLAELLRRMG